VTGLWLIAPALAIAPVLESVEAGQINWTTMQLEITSHSNRTVGAWKNVRVQEQDALDHLKPLIDDAARGIRFDPKRHADDLLSADEGGAPPSVVRRLDDGIGSWRVRETRYLSNGGVEMDAVLEIHRWLRPMLLSLAQPNSPAPTEDGTTGILIDARHLSFQPCVAPEVRTDTGTALVHPSRVHPEVLRSRSPAVYVSDPADPTAAKRTGEHPIFISAVSSQRDCILTLSAADSRLLENNRGFRNAVAGGRVVLVVTP
jgi:hypothetical protein